MALKSWVGHFGVHETNIFPTQKNPFSLEVDGPKTKSLIADFIDFRIDGIGYWSIVIGHWGV